MLSPQIAQAISVSYRVIAEELYFYYTKTCISRLFINIELCLFSMITLKKVQTGSHFVHKIVAPESDG